MITPFLDYDFGPHFEPNDMRGALDSNPPRVRRVLPSRRSADRPRRQRARGREVAARRQPARHLHGVEPHGERLRERAAVRILAADSSHSPRRVPNASRAAIRVRRSRSATARTTAYVRGVRETANRLVRERLLLAEDAERIVADAERSDVLTQSPKPDPKRGQTP